jgi:CDGSH-type Zn-finger protein
MLPQDPQSNVIFNFVIYKGMEVMPYAIEVKAGLDYWLCVCGKSGTGLCNGSHKTTDKTPSKYTPTKDETVYVCGCTRTGNSPFCDGTHKTPK